MEERRRDESLTKEEAELDEHIKQAVRELEKALGVCEAHASMGRLQSLLMAATERRRHLDLAIQTATLTRSAFIDGAGLRDTKQQ